MSLAKIWKIARHEFLVNVRRPAFIFVTLLIPALGVVMLVVGAFFSGQASSFLQKQFVSQVSMTGVVDHSGLYSPIPSRFSGRYVAYSDEESARRALVADQIGSFVVIPQDYIQTGKVDTYLRQGGLMSNSGTSATSTLSMFLVSGLLAGKVDDAIARRAASPANVNLITLDSKGQPAAGGSYAIVAGFVAPYAFSILLFISVLSSSNYLLRGISEEKENRVIEIILSSVSPAELLGGKVIGLGALGLTQILVWLLSAVLLSGGMGAVMTGAVLVLNPSSFVLAAIYFLLGYVLYGTTMAAAGSLGTSMRESQQLAGIFTFLAAVPWFFASLVFTNPNAALLRVLTFFPFTAPTMMMLRIPLTEVPAIDIIGSILVLLISIPVVLWAGAKIFRMGLLMYGKRPALGEVVRALRQA